MRRRSRRRSGTRARSVAAVVLAVAVLGAAAGALPAQSFDSASAPRGSAVAVSSDETASLGLDAAPAVHVNETEPLVNVTNHLGRDADATVALREGSEPFATLVVDGTAVGNQTTFSLADGATRTVSVELPDDSSLTDEHVAFDVRASAPGLAVRAPNRSVPVNA